MQPRNSPAEEMASAYWNENREKANDSSFWMAHPLCREAINRRVGGSSSEWPLDWFKRVHAREPFRRGVSWGCGLGSFERSAIRAEIVRKIDAFDISPASLEDARRLASEEGIAGASYAVGSFNRPRLPSGLYDIVFFHQSLHHVARLERLFEAIRRALPRDGACYVDEYVGPSRSEWRREHLACARSVLDRLSLLARVPRLLELPIEQGDPSEAVRSGEIVEFLREYVDITEWRPYGGQIASLVFPYLRPEWVRSEEGMREISEMLALEDRQLSEDPFSSHYLVAYGRLKPKRPLARRLRFRARRLLTTRS